MKKHLLTKMTLLLCALVAGGNNMWADSYTITFKTGNGDGTSASTSTDCSTIVSAGSSYLSGKLATATNVYYSGGSGLKLGTSSNAGVLKMNLATSVRPTSIVVNAKLYNSSKAATIVVNGKTAQSLSADFNNYTFTYDGSAEISYIQLNSSKYCWVSSVTVNYVPAGTTYPPTIVGVEDFFSTRSVSITNATIADGATIYYTLNGTDPTTTTSETCFEYSEPFVISASTTVKAIAKKASDINASSVVSKTFTKQTPLNGISSLHGVADGTYYVSLSNAQFTYIKNKNGFLNDASAGIYYYNASVAPVLKKTFNGIYQVNVQDFSGMPEILSITEIEGECSTTIADEVQAPVVMTASALNDAFTANLGRQIQINNYTVTDASKLIGDIYFSTTYYNPSLTVGTKYNLVGYPYRTNSAYDFRLVSAAIVPESPTFDPVEGEFSEAFTLHLACTTDGVTMYYTTDGSTPTTSSTEYDDATGIAIPAATTTVKAIAVKDAVAGDVATATYTYKSLAKPLFGTASGTAVYYGTKIEVTCATAGADIYYTLTTDGSTPADPTSASTAYPDGGIAINANTVKIKAIAKKGEEYSSVASATYTLKNPEAPTFSPAAGAVARNTVVTISSAEGTSIKYTTDGSDANTGTDANSNSVEVSITAGMTIKAIASDPESNTSSESSAAYTIAQVATPTFSVAEGQVLTGSTVTLTTATEGATIHYTTNGEAPTASSATYSDPVVVDADMTIKAIAVKDNYVDSEVASVDYTTIEAIPGYSINFEATDLVQYVDWEMENVGIHTSTISAHGGLYYGSNVNSKDNATTTASIKTKSKISHPGTFTCCISKESTNTTASSWKVQVSENGSTWTDVKTADAASVTKGNWTEVSADLSSYSNVFVRLYYTGSNAVRAVDDIVLTEYVPITITCEGGYASFSYGKALDFTGSEATAYIIKNTSENYATLTQVTKVPANTGIIVTGTKGETYNISVTNAATDNVTGNLLHATSTGATDVVKDEAYGLSKTDGLFHLLNAGTIPANKAYLLASEVFPDSTPAPSLTFYFGETTDISQIDKGELRIENGVYNLAGQRIVQPSKGIYIVNGKKVVIK